MKIALHDSDKTNFPNLALMKLSAWHKKQGDEVEFFMPFFADFYDKIYSSKVFTFNPIDPYLPSDERVIKAGIGYHSHLELDEEIEHIMPDYSIYRLDYSVGFLTRGCIRQCPWCIVPKKEGKIHSNADITEFLAHNKAVLMDNNVLACDFGITQLDKIAKLGIKVDFNQGLDARLIDNEIAKRLAKIKWLYPVRLACDTKEQMPTIEKTVKLLRANGCTPQRYFCYVLVKDIEDAMERVEFLRKLNISSFCQPYRDFENNIQPTQKQKDFARWVNHKAIFNTVPFNEYKKKNPTHEESNMVI